MTPLQKLLPLITAYRKDLSLDLVVFLFTCFLLVILFASMALIIIEYADDTQVYLSVNPVQQNVAVAVQRMETCFDEIRLWMSQNHLKLNNDKTEFIIIGFNPQRAKVFVPHTC